MIWQARDHFLHRNTLIKVTDNFLLEQIVFYKQYYAKSKETIGN